MHSGRNELHHYGNFDNTLANWILNWLSMMASAFLLHSIETMEAGVLKVKAGPNVTWEAYHF